MAQVCQHCHKGVGYGHAVSHAKNRVRRLFKPNLQKLKVWKNDIFQRVKLCTSCIKRLRKDGKLGRLVLKKAIKEVKIIPPPKIVPLEKKKEEKAAETLNIEAIVGKKS